MYLYNYGNEDKSITGGIKYFATFFGNGIQSTNESKVTFESNLINIVSGTGTTNNVHTLAITTNKIGMKGYTKLNVIYSQTNVNPSLPYTYFGVALGNSNSQPDCNGWLDVCSWVTYKREDKRDGSTNTLVLDISNYNDSYYIILENEYAGYSRVYSIYLS